MTKTTAVAGRSVVHLDREECLRLVQYEAFVGRIGFLHNGVMNIVPVNYLADEKGLVFCTAPGGKLSALAGGADAVFEVDASTAFEHGGWSVVVRGRSREVADEEELEFLRRGPLKSWAVSPLEHWIRIEFDEVSGVRVLPH